MNVSVPTPRSQPICSEPTTNCSGTQGCAALAAFTRIMRSGEFRRSQPQRSWMSQPILR